MNQTYRRRRDFRFAVDEARLDYGRPDRQRFLRRDRWLPEGLAFAAFCAALAMFLVVGVPA